MPLSWENRPVLVTGAGGFIGSHLVEKLVQQGAKVRAFVRYNSRNDVGLLRFLPGDLSRRVEIVTGDLRDQSAVSQSMKGVTHVFHLGALIAIPYSYQNPADVIETNILGTLNVLMSARTEKVERVVHTSTSEVYGTALRVPIDETHPLQGQSPYSASKIGADKLAESFFYSFNLPVVIIRPFNTYGPRQSARAIIPTLITQALVGDVIKIGNTNALRDFTYVSDTVDGFIKIAEAPGIEGQTYNLGTGTEISIGELAELTIALTDHPVKLQIDENRLRPEKSEVQRLLSDNRRALEAFGWSPQVPFPQGLLQTYEWIKQNLSMYSTGRYVV